MTLNSAHWRRMEPTLIAEAQPALPQAPGVVELLRAAGAPANDCNGGSAPRDAHGRGRARPCSAASSARPGVVDALAELLLYLATARGREAAEARP